MIHRALNEDGHGQRSSRRDIGPKPNKPGTFSIRMGSGTYNVLQIRLEIKLPPEKICQPQLKSVWVSHSAP
jgi:hypothetical protein